MDLPLRNRVQGSAVHLLDWQWIFFDDTSLEVHCRCESRTPIDQSSIEVVGRQVHKRLLKIEGAVIVVVWRCLSFGIAKTPPISEDQGLGSAVLEEDAKGEQ